MKNKVYYKKSQDRNKKQNKKMISSQFREFEAEVKRIGGEVTSSLKQILPSSNNNNNFDEKTQTTNTRMIAPRHSMPALRHSMMDLKRWSLDVCNLGEAAGIGITPIDQRFFTLPLQHLLEQDRVSFLCNNVSEMSLINSTLL